MCLEGPCILIAYQKITFSNGVLVVISNSEEEC